MAFSPKEIGFSKKKIKALKFNIQIPSPYKKRNELHSKIYTRLISMANT